MLKRGIFICLLILFGTGLRAQHVSHQVLVPLASVSSNNEISIGMTVGEAMVAHIFTNTHGLTQGFQQPLYSRKDSLINIGNGVNVYPNPVRHNLTMDLFGERSIEYTVTIFGINGAIYFKNVYPCVGIFNHKITLNVSDYRSGTYFVRVVAADGTISRLFKIQKM